MRLKLCRSLLFVEWLMWLLVKNDAYSLPEQPRVVELWMLEDPAQPISLNVLGTHECVRGPPNPISEESLVTGGSP